MTVAYFDCFAGVAGDMVLGTLVDAGMPLAHLKRELAKLGISGYVLERKRTRRFVSGTSLRVRVERETAGSRYIDIKKLIERSRLNSSVKHMSLAIMKRLAEAEAKVHGVPVRNVHFHEVGAVDSIVDCVGAAIGFDYFGFDLIASSPLPITRGRVSTAHGDMPVPAPATLELVKGIPLEPASVTGEIVTPTGAAILTAVSHHFGTCPLERIERIGYGFGERVFKDRPNALRVMIGQGFPVVVVEATIDDMNPQVYDYVMERLFERGVIDVTLTPVQMKKNRPGIVLACQVPWHLKDAAIAVILRETTTTGVRFYPVDRRVMTREIQTITTKHGKIRVKVARDDELGIVKHIPEYDDVKAIAKKRNMPFLLMYREIMASLK